MNRTEIQQMSELEDDHWWYRGLRDLIGRTLQLPGLEIRAGACVLDAGCGTGANLRRVSDLLRPLYAGGFDESPVAIELCRGKAGDADIYRSDLRNPRLRVKALDVLLSCDALSIAGIADCMNGLQRLVGALRPGGLFILNLPAFRWLHSGHDDAIETRDRVTASEVKALMSGLGLKVELLTYRLFTLFPMIVGARLPSILRGDGRRARSDLKVGGRWTNRALAEIVYLENQAIVSGISFPCGSSVYAVGRKQ